MRICVGYREPFAEFREKVQRAFPFVKVLHALGYGRDAFEWACAWRIPKSPNEFDQYMSNGTIIRTKYFNEELDKYFTETFFSATSLMARKV
jgi:hypothetical protein